MNYGDYPKWQWEWIRRWIREDIPEDEWPWDELPDVRTSKVWDVWQAWRLSACDNRPGLKKIRINVYDAMGEPLQGVKIRFDTEPSQGIAYDHRNIWGVTDENGYLEWDHLGKPTRYLLWMGDDEEPLVTRIRTDLGNAYCKPPGTPWWSGNRPVNRPGIYSYKFEFQRKGKGT